MLGNVAYLFTCDNVFYYYSFTHGDVGEEDNDD